MAYDRKKYDSFILKRQKASFFMLKNILHFIDIMYTN